ncbi:MAG: PQQ-binding-like beta-propeller repeat protein [Actinomycetota bacterium]|nr:PQQ-binding-like beta-propeller repeat protein [Actinomycetota bacterium]
MRTMLRASALVGVAAVVIATMASPAIAAPGHVYVANSGSNSVSVVDPATGSVAGTIPVGASPSSIVFTPDGARAYVSNTGSDTVSVLDTATGAVVATIAVGDAPAGAAATADGTRVYVTNTGSGTVSVLDTATNTVTAIITVGGAPRAVAVTPDGTRAVAVPGPMVADNSPFGSHHTLSLIDTVANTASPIGDFATRNVPWDVDIAPDGSRAYVALGASTPGWFGGLFVLDLHSLSLSRLCGIGGEPPSIFTCINDVLQVALSPDGGTAYALRGNFISPLRIEVIDIATDTILATILFSHNDFLSVFFARLALSSDGTRAYVSSPASDRVFVVDTVAYSVIGRIPVGSGPQGLAVQPARVTPGEEAPESDGDTAVLPSTKDQCKDGGHEDFGFKNQGECVSFVVTGGKDQPGKKSPKS